ncbi:MAG: 16S rRNA (guanine(966)-N(2))-methyltransferase RsmD [Bdellovibrio sp. CG10_big_fil_rev_8_21_14_0_10_47_8]|nr:MAG: 16S rRNA (guanine(966)-N(2))-methyltransferase RsmD [Bdellovibrio sp. CG10_big_fil_rev_8_21_14_0_10_47_8]
MRIISGKYKGHHLASFQADHIRPTTDRVKETLFNKIQGWVEGARVLDLFSGTGNLGLEALSRGAREVVFVEKSKKSISILEKNLDKLGVDEPYSIVQKDVLAFLRNYTGEAFDLIFADPPFTEEMAHDVMLAADGSAVFQAETLMMIESGRREKIMEDYPSLSRYDVREFGDKFLSFYKKK